MRKQIPDGPDDLYCHRCLPKKVAMSKVCKTCPLWMQVRGTDKNTGREVDEWMCADRAQIVFLAEIAKNALSGVSATESFRNEMVSMNLAHLNARKTEDQFDRMTDNRCVAAGRPVTLLVDERSKS